mgnify:CR=1 FL=1
MGRALGAAIRALFGLDKPVTNPKDYQAQDLFRYYREDHALDRWPRNLLQEFKNLGLRVLNVGCGRAESVLADSTWIGVDFNPDLRRIWEVVGVERQCHVADVQMIPSLFKEDEFDVSYSCDFLEHVNPRLALETIQAMKHAAPAGFHIIDHAVQSGFRGVNGDNLHPSAHLPGSTWLAYVDEEGAKFEEFGPRHWLLSWGM